MSGAAFARHIAAEAARHVPLRAGRSGVLREYWADAAAVAWLRHICGRPTPEENPAAAAFSWHTHTDDARLTLDDPILGIHVRGVDPIALAEGVETLGEWTSALIPQAMAACDATGAAIETLLPRLLKQMVMTRVGQWPPGVTFAPSDTEAEARPAPLRAQDLRQAQAQLEVQDHRAILPVRSRRPAA
jgi:hypothetical protein